MMLSRLLILLVCLASLRMVYAEDVVSGIDLDRVNWPFLCQNVGSIQFVQNGMECEVSHPASKFHSSKVHNYIAEHFAMLNSCEHLNGEYEELIKPQGIKGKEWKLCRSIFTSSLFDRIRHPENYVHSTNEWISVHFNDQTMIK